MRTAATTDISIPTTDTAMSIASRTNSGCMTFLHLHIDPNPLQNSDVNLKRYVLGVLKNCTAFEKGHSAM